MSASQIQVRAPAQAQWRRLCLPSFVLATITARFPARRHTVGRTGLAGRPVPVEQDGPPRPALLLLADQLIEPFRSQT